MKMKQLLIDEPYLIVCPTLAKKLGINEAIVLQQLHFRLQKSPLKYEGYTWYNHTYAKWQKQFPFWSEKTISRIFLNLEKDQIIVSSQEYNPIKTYKTKYYRIDYDVLSVVLKEEQVEASLEVESQVDCTNEPVPDDSTGQISLPLQDNYRASMKEEIKEENKNPIVEKNLDVAAEIIHYLNKKTNRNYRVNNKSTRRFINARLKEGYQLEDFKRVIDLKVMQWLHDPRMKTFLRPNTLFNPTNFENYLVECNEIQTMPTKQEIKPIVLDFDLGEED